MTAEMRRWCADHEIRSDPDYETPRFVDHYRSRGTAFADPVPAWRNWMRTADGWAKPASSIRPGKNPASIAKVRGQLLDRNPADSIDVQVLNGSPT